MRLVSRSQIRRAGKTLATEERRGEAFLRAVEDVNAWRELHRIPLERLLHELGAVARERPEVMVSGRIKKLDTIVDKVRREGLINNLATMCDIAGCRIVVPDLADQRAICAELMESKAGSEGNPSMRDYLTQPRDSGYRAIHLVFKYALDGTRYCLPVELQIRTRLQHMWATAVELYDTSVGARLKFEQRRGDDSDFFRRAAELIRHLEEGSLDEMGACYGLPSLIAAAERVLGILDEASMSIWPSARGGDESEDWDYLLVDLVPSLQSVDVRELAEEDAISTYFAVEAASEEYEHDVVLIKGSSLDTLKGLYPNYFGDASSFSRLVRQHLDRFA